jgi:hypothetical protein
MTKELNLQETLEPNEVIELFKGFDIGTTKGEELTEVSYENDTYNPFDVTFNGRIKLNNGLIMDIDRVKSKGFNIRVGYDSNWIGGLSFSDVRVSFYIKELTMDNLRVGLTEAMNNIKYSLVCRYHSCAHPHKIFKVGSVEEIIAEAERLGYETKDEWGGEFPYFINKDLGNSTESLLSITYLSDEHIERINNENK